MGISDIIQVLKRETEGWNAAALMQQLGVLPETGGLCRSRVDEQSEDLADRALSADGFGQRKMVWDAGAVATSVLVLYDIAGFGQVGDDAKGTALGDVGRGGDVAQTHAGVVRDADEDEGMVGKEAPLGHGTSIDKFFLN